MSLHDASQNLKVSHPDTGTYSNLIVFSWLQYLGCHYLLLILVQRPRLPIFRNEKKSFWNSYITSLTLC